jgi:hypothetical protein
MPTATENDSLHKSRALPLHERIAILAREGSRLRGPKRGGAVRKREIDELWGNS